MKNGLREETGAVKDADGVLFLPPLRAGGTFRVTNSLDEPSMRDRVLEVWFNRRPTDQELMAFHQLTVDFLRITPAPPDAYLLPKSPPVERNSEGT